MQIVAIVKPWVIKVVKRKAHSIRFCRLGFKTYEDDFAVTCGHARHHAVGSVIRKSPWEEAGDLWF